MVLPIGVFPMVDDFVAQVETDWQRGLHTRSYQRKGQWAMNRLAEVRPDLYAELTGALGIDPFYDDGCLDRFWLELIEIW